MHKEHKRKIFHIILGIILAFIILNVRKIFLIPFLTFIICCGIFIRLLLLKGFEFKILAGFLINFGRPYEIGLGAMNFLIGVLISLIFPFPREFCAIGVLILGISDGLATIIGINSKVKLFDKKTFNGTTAFFATSFIIVLIFTKSILTAIIVPIILTVLELFSPIDDNLLIPTAGTLLISVINALL